MKKGRHRRFEEARALKRSTDVDAEPCPECGSQIAGTHASWCHYDDDSEPGAEAEAETEYGA